MAKKTKSAKQGDTHAEIRQLGVLIEHVGDDVKLVAEQYGDIKKDIHGIKQTLDSHTKILDSHTETLGSHTEMIGSLTIDMQIVKRDIEIMKTDIEFIKTGFKKKVDLDEFAALARRVALLERHR